MPITALPALNRTSATFKTDVDTFFGSQLPAFAAEANALQTDVNAKQVTASAAAVTAAAQVTLATTQANLATTNGAAQVTLAAAQVALADADAIATAADRVQTGQDRVQTGQDRVQTGADRTAAAASAVQASKLNLGNKTSAPTLDNQGAALLAGATYYDTVLSKWRVWSGTAWTDGISSISGVSSVNGLTGYVTLPPTQTVPYASRATLRSQTPAAGEMAVVEGLGLFIWESASTEPDDDESAFATASGAWLLQAASWDLVDSWQAPDQQALTDDDEDEPARFATSFATKVITATYTNTVSSVGPSVTTTQVVAVAGAVVGDAVLITRSGVSTTKPDGDVYGVVTAADTVTVYYYNPSNATTDYYLTTGNWRITVIKS